MGLILHDKDEPIPASTYLDIYNKYMELIYAVERHFPDETRHETALRYIREAEANAMKGEAKQEKV